MATAKTAKKEQPTLTITGMRVDKVRRISEKVIGFSLNGNGLGLYNLKVIEGKEGEFIAAPQEKGKDGKYYNVYAVYFSKDDEAKIIAKVKEKVPAAEAPKEAAGSDF